MIRRPPSSPLFPSTTLFRSLVRHTPPFLVLAPQALSVSPAPPPSTARGLSACKGVPFPTTLITRSEEHTSELQSQSNLVCRLLLEKKKKKKDKTVEKNDTDG